MKPQNTPTLIAPLLAVPCKLLLLLLLPLLILLPPTLANAQTPDWAWAKSAAGGKARAVCTDKSGNVFVTGEFAVISIKLGTTTLFNPVTTGNIPFVAFLTKYDPSGKVLWAKAGAGCEAIAVDPHGNVIVGGYLSSSFLIKFDTDGTVLWTQTATGNYKTTAITSDALGNIYVTGNFHSPTITFGTTILTSQGNGAVFLVKYDSAGNILWAKSAAGGAATAVSSDAAGNIFLTGYFNSPVIVFGPAVLSNVGNRNMFIVKFDIEGNVRWARSVGGSYYDMGTSITADPLGNVFVVGHSQSPSISFGTLTLTNVHMFIAKYNSSGNILWVTPADGNWRTHAAADAWGNVIVTGGFWGPKIIFGKDTLINTSSSDDEIFVVKYDSDGAVLWARGAGGTNDEVPTSIAIDTQGNTFIAGYFYSPVITFGSTSMTFSGTSDIFVASIGATTPIPTGTENFTKNNNIKIYPNPATSLFTIETKNTKPENKKLAIHNLAGEKILHSSFITPSSQIDLSTQPNGIYFIRLHTENEQYDEKLILSK